MSKKSFIYVLLAISCIFIWGITFVSTRYLLRSFTSMEILIIRFLLAYIALWLIKPEFLRLPSIKTELYFLGAGFCGVTFYQLLENIALSYTHAANVSIIVSICPMITAMIAQFVLKEKHLNLFFILGFIVAISGITLVSFNGSLVLHLNPKGDLLALSAAVSWGFYSLFVTKINRLGIKPILCTRRSFFWALVLMIPVTVACNMLLGPNSFAAININPKTNLLRFSNFLNWFNLIFLGIGASAYCFAIWNLVCNYFGTVRTTVGIYLSPVITIVFGFLFLAEPITLMGTIGAVMTIAGLFVANKKKSQSK